MTTIMRLPDIMIVISSPPISAAASTSPSLFQIAEWRNVYSIIS